MSMTLSDGEEGHGILKNKPLEQIPTQHQASFQLHYCYQKNIWVSKNEISKNIIFL